MTGVDNDGSSPEPAPAVEPAPALGAPSSEGPASPEVVSPDAPASWEKIDTVTKGADEISETRER